MRVCLKRVKVCRVCRVSRRMSPELHKTWHSTRVVGWTDKNLLNIAVRPSSEGCNASHTQKYLVDNEFAPQRTAHTRHRWFLNVIVCNIACRHTSSFPSHSQAAPRPPITNCARHAARQGSLSARVTLSRHRARARHARRARRTGRARRSEPGAEPGVDPGAELSVAPGQQRARVGARRVVAAAREHHDAWAKS